MSEELKPVKCGCGGETVIMPTPSGRFAVGCKKCDICTGLYNTEAEAITAWNRAMSGIPRNPSTVERTAKGEYSNAYGEYLCSECGRVVQIEDAYCPGCGARLEWNE